MPLYIRVTNPWFLEQDNAGRPAAGYLVYTLVAGTVSTLVDTYSDRELTVPNTNPIVLNVYGEARIFTDIDLKLVYTSPTGDLTSPIWTEDYVAEQQSVVSDKGYGLRDANNLYTLDIVPAYTSIPDGFSLVMIPDASNLGTLVIQPGHTIPTVFTGTGINDALFSGAYSGAVAGAVFSVTIDTLYIEAPAAPILAANSTAGLVTAGNHSVKITAVTAEGETEPSAASNIIAAAGSKQLDVTGIPAIGGTITGYNVYMNKAGGTTWYFVALVITTTYTINIADASLTVVAPTTNTTGSGAGGDTFSWQIDGGVATAGVPITSGVAQSLQDGIYIMFSIDTTHTVGDDWTLTVMTPASLDFCGLGSVHIEKSEGGQLRVLDTGDIIEDYPAHLDYSLSQNRWLLINPSLPVLESIIPLRNRKEVRADYTVNPTLDQGTELNAIGTLTITLPACTEAVSHFFYFRNGGTGVVTIDAGTYLIKGPGVYLGASTLTVVAAQCIQLATNGVDWHVMTDTGGTTNMLLVTSSTTWTAPTTQVFVVGSAGGGGGHGGEALPGVQCGAGGAAGGVLSTIATFVPGLVYTITLGAGGGGGAVDTVGFPGGNTTIVNGATTVFTVSGGVGGASLLDCADRVTYSNDVAMSYGTYGKGGIGGDANSAGDDGSPGFVFLMW